MNDIARAINSFLAGIESQTLLFFTAIAGVGVLSMAIIQTVKDTLPVRRWYQTRWIRHWLDTKWQSSEHRTAIPSSRPSRSGSPTGFARVEIDLVMLATDGDAKAFYDLPIEQLCGQMNVAAQGALDYPEHYAELLACLASRATPSDVRQVMNPPPAARVQRSDDDEIRREVQNHVDARNRVNQQVQRAIDAVQITLGFRWKFWLQIASITLSAVIAGIGVVVGGVSGGGVTTTIAVAVLGGFLAPVARDLVASVQQLRS